MPRKQKSPYVNSESHGSNCEGSCLKWQPAKIPSFDEARCTWDQYCRRIQNKFVLILISKSQPVLALLDATGEHTYAKVSDLCFPNFPENKTLGKLLDILSFLNSEINSAH